MASIIPDCRILKRLAKIENLPEKFAITTNLEILSKDFTFFFDRLFTNWFGDGFDKHRVVQKLNTLIESQEGQRIISDLTPEERQRLKINIYALQGKFKINTERFEEQFYSINLNINKPVAAKIPE